MEHTKNETIIHDTDKESSWEQQTAMKVSGISILVNLLLSIFKLIAGIAAHSGAMISDAIHSASDVGSTFIVIIGVRLSAKKSDKEHQYGHERMECVSSIVLAGMLLVTGLGIGITGVRDIVKSTSGGTIAIPGTLALIAAVVSIVIKEWMFWYTRGAAKKINSGALMADAWHHRSDALSSIGAFVGIFGARLGYPILDPVASIVICFMIAKAAIDIFRDAIDKMVDHSCDAKPKNRCAVRSSRCRASEEWIFFEPAFSDPKCTWISRSRRQEKYPSTMHMILRKMCIIPSKINSKT